MTTAMHVAVIAYLVTLSPSVVKRVPPIAKARAAGPRISALIGTLLATAIVPFSRRPPLYLAEGVATVGGVMQSARTAMLLGVQIAFQLWRIRNARTMPAPITRYVASNCRLRSFKNRQPFASRAVCE